MRLEVTTVYEDSRHAAETSDENPLLLVWSAADAAALTRMLQKYETYYLDRIAGRGQKLKQLAHTLAARRNTMTWRSFAIVNDDDASRDAVSNDAIPALLPAKPLRSQSGRVGLALIFTGQGAQYAGMGLGLLRYPVFERSLRETDEIFKSLGCEWSVFGESRHASVFDAALEIIVKHTNHITDAINDVERIGRPEYSQPLCTALQIALVELLTSFDIKPTAVVGHSSGEIAAAYAAGALSHECACAIAYFRGKFAGQLRDTMTVPGAMLSANLVEEDVVDFLHQLGLGGSKETAIHLACVNSPKNVTLAGPEESINIAKESLDSRGIFAQKLKTGIAYHSPVMQSIAQDYMESLGGLQGHPNRTAVPMISSVTGGTIEPQDLQKREYWARNLVSQVRFRASLETMVRMAKIRSLGGVDDAFPLTDVVEVGPHSALKRPVTDTIEIRYHSWLQRSAPAVHGTLDMVGKLYSIGHPVSVTAANTQQHTGQGYLVDCPPYPFNHAKRYWSESRQSKNWRLREPTVGYLLGRRVHDWNPLKPRWKNHLSVETTPWVGDHGVSAP